MAHDPPHGTSCHCDVCDTAVDGLQMRNLLESPQHTFIADGQPRPAEVIRRSVLEMRSADPGGGRPQAAPRTTAPSTRSQRPAEPPRWHCAICDRVINMLQKASHLAGKPHLAKARQEPNSTANPIHHRLLEPDRLPSPRPVLPVLPAPCENSSCIDYSIPFTRIPPFAQNPTASFYCLTCAADFAPSTKYLHLPTTPTWTCPACTTTLHPVAREQHPHSAAHTMALATPPSFYCRACQCVSPLHTKVAHLAGEPHRFKAVKHLREERCYRAPRPPLRCEWMPRHAPPGGVPATPDQGPAFCVRCYETVGVEALESHVRLDCAGVAARRERTPTPTQQNATPTQQNATPPQRNVPADPKPKPVEKRNKWTKKPRMDGALYCDVCKAYQPVAEIAAHISSMPHQNKVAAQQQPGPSVDAASSSQALPVSSATPVVATPYMTFTGDSFYCSVCARTRLVKGIVSHVGSKVHRRNIAAAEAAG